jgi:hypothetical protein
MATLEQAEKIIDDESLAEESLLDELESDDIPSHIREARLEQFKRMTRDFHDMKGKSHGLYTDIVDEKVFLETTTTEDRCVIHFFHADFRRCAIVDSHLKKLAAKHFTTKFARISVDTAKFFTTKLKIQVLPAIVCFIKGIVVDRVIGFDELGDQGDNFPTEVLERRLVKSNVVMAGPGGVGGTKGATSVLGRGEKEEGNSDDENDW